MYSLCSINIHLYKYHYSTNIDIHISTSKAGKLSLEMMKWIFPILELSPKWWVDKVKTVSQKEGDFFYFAQCLNKILNTPSQRKKVYCRSRIVEVSVHGWLIPKQRDRGRRALQRRNSSWWAESSKEAKQACLLSLPLYPSRLPIPTVGLSTIKQETIASHSVHTLILASHT